MTHGCDKEHKGRKEMKTRMMFMWDVAVLKINSPIDDGESF